MSAIHPVSALQQVRSRTHADARAPHIGALATPMTARTRTSRRAYFLAGTGIAPGAPHLANLPLASLHFAPFAGAAGVAAATGGAGLAFGAAAAPLQTSILANLPLA